ncbi:MAG: carbon storage regulator CsrA [Nocardioidaceae bacterium]
MLVLSRRVGESVVIGDDVVVTVLDVRGDIVRIGVSAPRHVAVHREELLREIEKSNRAAVSPSEAAVTALRRAAQIRGRAADQDTGTKDNLPDA